MSGEHQDVQPPEEHGIHVQEIDCEDPGGLGAQELPPARARASRCRIDARGMQDLPHGGRCDCQAELCELAVDAAVSPRRIFLRQADDKAAMPGTVGGRPGLRLFVMSYFLAASLRCQASSVAGVTGKTSAQRLRGTSRASAKSQARSPGS
jgi:hypothetical protein